VYVIKENRTYDQVFGDMGKGNSDPKLCTFGKKVTPNHHALAEQFVLLDNFYCNGVLSADGYPISPLRLISACRTARLVASPAAQLLREPVFGACR